MEWGGESGACKECMTEAECVSMNGLCVCTPPKITREFSWRGGGGGRGGEGG